MPRTLEQWKDAIREEVRKRDWPYRWRLRRVCRVEQLPIIVAQFVQYRAGTEIHRWLNIPFHCGELEDARMDWRVAVRILVEDGMVKHTEAASDSTLAEIRDANEYFGILDRLPYRDSWRTDEEMLRISAQRRGITVE
jgi:hypothetical protein